MNRLATVRWSTPASTGVDEELAVFDDGVGLLAVRVPRMLGPAIGTYRCRAAEDDMAALSAAGPGPILIDLRAPRRDDAAGTLASRAERVAAAALQNPVAVATFHVGAVRRGSVLPLSVALYVVASGERAVEFELDPGAISVQFIDSGQELGWEAIPALTTGFVTADAAGLGGLRRRAVVKPGGYGAITFDTNAPEMASVVGLRVGGWLSEALPDDRQPARFDARVAESPITSS